MKKAPFVLGLLVFLTLNPCVEACRHRRAWRSSGQLACSPVVSYQQPVVYTPQPTSYIGEIPAVQSTPESLPAAYAEPVTPSGVQPDGVQPQYRYDVSPGETAYYYTYDASGKLIIQQWMDFVFRGGRQAGMPRPPLPIIGRLTRP